MNRPTTVLLTMLAAVVATVPSAAAPGHGEEHLYLLAEQAAFLTLEVHYSDGVATTKFAFVQLAGANNGPGERLKPTPECTEWIGTFTEAAAMLGADDHVANSTLRIRFQSATVPLAAPTTFVDVPLDLEVISSVPGGLKGSILTCDQASGGLLRMNFQLTEQLDRFYPALVRVNLEESS